MFTNSREEGFHVIAVAAFDNVEKFSHLLLDFFNLLRSVGIEEDFADKEIVFRHEPACNLHVALEGCSGCFLMFHDSGKSQCGRKRNRQRIGYGLVVFGKGIFDNVEMKTRIQVAEKHFAEMVAFADYDGVFIAEVAQRSECRPEHGMGADEGMAACGIKFRQSGLDRCYVAYDT